MASRNEVLRAAELGERIPYRLWLPYVEAPTWLQGYWGLRWNESIGLFVDSVVDAWRGSIRIAFPSTVPDDALDRLGPTSLLERLPGELNGPYRSRLERRWEAWQESGSRPGIAGRLAEYIGTNPTITCWDMAAKWTDLNTWSWDRLWVVVDQPHGFGPLLASEDLLASEELVAGIEGLSQTQYRVWRRLAHKWRDAHARPVEFIVVFDGPIASPSTIAADTLIAGEDAIRLPITAPVASEKLIAGDNVVAGYFIEPV